MRKILLLVVCCICLCGCDDEQITICNYYNNEFPNDKHKITIKHINNEITYYKNEYETVYETIAEAEQEVEKHLKYLTCTDDICYAPTEGEDGWKYIVTRNNKTVFLTQETNNYEKSYMDEIKYLESLTNYECDEK